MHIKMHLKVSADQLFDCILNSVAADASEYKGKTIKAEDLKRGFSYTKHLNTKTGKEATVKTKIVELERPSLYSVHFIIPRNTTAITYKLTDCDSGVDVDYSEEIITDSGFDFANYKLMSFLYSWKAKKRARMLLRGMESYILDSQKEVED